MQCDICHREMIRAGKHRTKKGLWQRWKCQKCGIYRLSSEPIKE